MILEGSGAVFTRRPKEYNFDFPRLGVGSEPSVPHLDPCIIMIEFP